MTIVVLWLAVLALWVPALSLSAQAADRFVTRRGKDTGNRI